MSGRFIELISDESFQRWIGGRANQSEMAMWDKWLQESSYNKTLYHEASNLLKSVKFKTGQHPDLKKEWERLNTRLNLSEGSQNCLFPENKLNYKRSNVNMASYRFLGIAAAAIIIIVFFLHFEIWQKIFNIIDEQEYHYVSTEYSQRAKINLSDGTRIVLNANSTLGYPVDWTMDTPRRLVLEGEAYFDVVKTPDNEGGNFTVITTSGKIKVSGTKFVVHERGKGTSVVLEEGKVEVFSLIDSSFNANKQVSAILRPGQIVQFQKNDSELIPQNTNIGPYISWWRKHFIFDKTPFILVVKRLEETYGIKVKVNDDRLLERTLSGSIENHNLFVLTDALGQVLNVPVRRDGKTVIFGELPK